MENFIKDLEKLLKNVIPTEVIKKEPTYEECMECLSEELSDFKDTLPVDENEVINACYSIIEYIDEQLALNKPEEEITKDDLIKIIEQLLEEREKEEVKDINSIIDNFFKDKTNE